MKEKLESEWHSMEILLQFLQIVFSSKVRKSDVDRLRNLAKEHLEYLIGKGLNLLPKYHNITHYARLFPIIGPLIHSWMMRYESKHKLSTDLVHLTYNYKNLPLSIAKRHEARACLSQNDVFSVKFIVSKVPYDITQCNGYDIFKSHLPTSVASHIKEVRFIRIGSHEYRKGLMLIDNKRVYEILHVICCDSKYFVLCHKYNVLGFVACFNSIEVENDGSFHLIDINETKSHKFHDKICFNERMFIIADTLSIFDEF